MTTQILILSAISMALAPLSGCGAGAAGVVAAASSGGGGGGSVEPSVAVSQFIGKDTPSPSQIRISTRGPGGSASLNFVITVQDDDGNIIETVNQATILDALDDIPLAKEAQERTFRWDFESDIGEFADNVTITAQLLRNGQTFAGALRDQRVGNLTPQIASLEVPTAGTGTTKIPLFVDDESDENVQLKVEFQERGGPWRFATPSSADDSTTDFRDDDDFLSSPFVANEEILFFWESAEDLPGQQTEVRFRVTPKDDRDPGETQFIGERFVSPFFTVDNNVAPLALIDGGSLILNDDRRRGVVVPFELRDEDDSEVNYVLQWRRAGQDLEAEAKSLPTSVTELQSILEDPERREFFQILTERPTLFSGTTEPTNSPSSEVRLPELASSAIGVLDFGGIVGSEIEIIRPSLAPQTNWIGRGSLNAPVAAIPIDDGDTALVLDNPSGSGWRLRELDLGNGNVIRSIASSTGIPHTMAISLGENPEFVLVADDASDHRIRQVALDSGAITPLVDNLGSEVRGLAVLGPGSAVFTQSSELKLLSFEGASPRSSTIVADLATPWGVVRDFRRPNIVYVAENTFPNSPPGRIVAVDISVRTTTPVQSTATPLADIANPESIALEAEGQRLIIVTDDPGVPNQEIRGINLGGPQSGVGFEIQTGITGTLGDIHTGSNDLRVLAMTGEQDLALGGGVTQKRTIDAYDSTDQTVTVIPNFDPPLEDPAIWRIENSLPAELPVNATGNDVRFVWDSSEVAGGGDIVFRAIGFDGDVGVPVETGAPKNIAGPLSVDPIFLGLTGSDPNPKMVVVADLDQDSDLDLVTANESSSNLNIHFQVGPREFGSAVTLGGPGITDGAAAVAAADINKDGRVDVVCANSTGNTLTIFFQQAIGGTFGSAVVISDAAILDPRAVLVADMNGDDRLDIVCANRNGQDRENCGANANELNSDDNVAIFLQDGGGGFGLSENLVGGRGPRDLAIADVDNDGDLDIVSANEFSNNLTVFFQDPPGDFGNEQVDLGSSDTIKPKGVIALDLNDDGFTDIASANFFGHNIAFFFQDPDGNFGVAGEPNYVVGDFFNTKGALDIQAGDIDADGDLDILSMNRFDDNITLILQTAPGVFELDPNGPFADTSIFPGPESVAVANLDGDNLLDIAVVNSGFCDPVAGNDALTVIYQSTPGEFDDSEFVPLRDAMTVCPDAVAAGDLDSDGDLDLLVASSANLSIFFQVYPGGFLFDPNGPLIDDNFDVDGDLTSDFGEPKRVALVDLDGDADLDIVSANASSNNITVLEQTDPGVFEFDRILEDGAGLQIPFGIVARDFNADGFIDVAATYTDPGGTAIFLGSASGLPTTPNQVITGVNQSLEINAGDLNGDGRIDLIVAASGAIILYEQGSDGLFTERSREQGGLGTNLQAVEVADIDGDGRLDFVSGARDFFGSNGQVTVFFQVSDFNFDRVIISSGALGPGSVAISDIDSDGDLDVLVANEVDGDGNNLDIFLQTSPRTFVLGDKLGDESSTFSPRDIIAADLDGDGDPDIASANFAGDSITIFFGSH